MKKYELMVILDPTVSQEDRDASINELKTLFEKNEVKVTKEDVWGDKKMAYKMNKSDRGYYILFELEMDGKSIKTMTPTINLDKNIWRYMFTNLED